MASESSIVPPQSNRLRKCLQGLLTSWKFKLFMGSLILFNLFLTIAVTDITAKVGAKVPVVVEIGLYVTLLILSMEVCARIYTDGLQYFDSRFNVFDCVVIIIDVIVEVVSFLWRSHLPSFSVLRVLRVVRVTRAVGYMRDVRELYLMLHGLASAMKAILWAAFLIGSVMLLWSIVAVEVIHPLNRKLAASGRYDDCVRCEEAYSSVGDAFLTFLTTIIAGDGWGTVSLPVMQEYPYTVPFFAAVLFSVQLGLLNLILAVIVERAQEARAEDQEQKRRDRDVMLSQSKKRLRRFFMASDSNGNNKLSKEELLDGVVNNTDFSDVLHLLQLGADDMSTVFSMMDTNGDGEIDSDEFLEQVFKMRTQDSQTLLLFIKHVVQELREKTLEEIKKQISGLTCIMCPLDLPGGGRWPAMSTHDQKEEPTILKPEVPTGGCNSRPECDEPWREWQQWEVSHEDSQLAGSDNLIKNVAYEYGSSQVDDDLAALTRNIQHQIGELNLSCTVAQLPTVEETNASGQLDCYTQQGEQMGHEPLSPTIPIQEDERYCGHCDPNCKTTRSMSTSCRPGDSLFEFKR